MTSLARASKRPIVRNILLANGEKPERHRAFLKWLDEAHAEGLQVYGMAFTVRAPTIITFEDWSLWDGTPAWHDVMNGPVEERMAKMRDENVRAGLRREIDRDMIPGPGACGYPKDLIVHGSGGVAALEKFVGRGVAEIAREEGRHLADVILDISLESNFKAEFVGDAYGASAGLTAEVLKSPYAVPGISDGGAHCHFIVQGAYPTDLLEWMVREEGLITAEQAHYGLSRLPAHMCGMHDRGVIRVGAPADIVVYDPKTIRRTPAWNKAEKLYDQPANGWRRAQRAEGLHFTICNGVITFEDQACTGATPGRLIRQGSFA
jgi:N-acyl-D-aspartate/D-glutamate deacylase